MGTIKSATGLYWAHPVTLMVVAFMVVVDMEVAVGTMVVEVDMKAAKIIQGRKARVNFKQLTMVDCHVMVMVVEQR